MRVTIIGVDGLEHRDVDRLQLGNLQQLRRYKLSIPRECFRQIAPGEWSPWTPLCWMSIVTGELPPVGYRQELRRVYDNAALEWLRCKIGAYMAVVPGKRRLFKRAGFKLTKYRAVEEPRIGEQATIFDLARAPVDINVPSYSAGFTLRPFGVECHLDTREHLVNFDREDAAVKAEVKRHLRSGGYDLLFAYMRAIDHYGHQLYGSRSYDARLRLMDLFVREVSASVDGLLLVVSDHGFRALAGTRSGGTHSDYAFLSTNHPLPYAPRSLLDVYGVVKWALET